MSKLSRDDPGRQGELALTEIALLPENRPRNRYANILPYDNNIISTPNCKYLNGSYLQYSDKTPKYIATQGPLARTAADFYNALLDEKCRVVVMLTKTFENDAEKCFPYWPRGSLTLLEFGDITVSKQEVEPVFLKGCGENVELSKLSVRKGSDSPHEIYHIYFKAWPDFGVASPQNIIELIKLKTSIEEFLKLDNTVHPAVIHCSAGVGRTGTFCVIETILSGNNLVGTVPCIEQVVKQFRRQRMGMVQTADQFNLIYNTLNNF